MKDKFSCKISRCNSVHTIVSERCTKNMNEVKLLLTIKNIENLNAV